MVVHSRHRDLLLTRYSPVLNTREYLTVIVCSRHRRFLARYSLALDTRMPMVVHSRHRDHFLFRYSPVLNTREYLIFTVIVSSRRRRFLARYSLVLNTRELCS